jgi:hypothetical protein
MSAVSGIIKQKIVGELVEHVITIALINNGITINNNTYNGSLVTNQVFSVASTTWTVNHNRGVQPVVSVLNEAGQEITADVEHQTVNSFIVTFTTPQKGSVSYI